MVIKISEIKKMSKEEKEKKLKDLKFEMLKSRAGTTKKDGKVVTVVSGFDSGIDIKKTAKALKNELACGGTYKGNAIELQGDHTKKVKSLLVRLGFDEESIS